LTQKHGGETSDLTLSFNQTDNIMYIPIPSATEARVSMCLVVELWQMRWEDNPMDEVRGWGVIPLLMSNFDVLDGQFKLALLKGPIDPSIQQYSEFDAKIKLNLNAWLCNAYVDAACMPFGDDWHEVHFPFLAHNACPRHHLFLRHDRPHITSVTISQAYHVDVTFRDTRVVERQKKEEKQR
jgi:hypothetical protein